MAPKRKRVFGAVIAFPKPLRHRYKCGCIAPPHITAAPRVICEHCAERARLMAAAREEDRRRDGPPPPYLEIREGSTGKVFRFTVPKMTIHQRRRKNRQ
jgi:hypothetical protein